MKRRGRYEWPNNAESFRIKKNRVEKDHTRQILGGIALVLAVTINPTLRHDVLGSIGTHVTNSENIAEAVAEYDMAYHAASATGKFKLEYLNSNKTYLVKSFIGKKGILGIMRSMNSDSDTQDIIINNGCLAGTAYDIAGGTVEAQASADGLFVSSHASASASVPTAAANAEINPSNHDELIVQSGHTGNEDLRFHGLLRGNSLEPSDDHTKSILETYGCKKGVVNILDTVYDSGVYYDVTN